MISKLGCWGRESIECAILVCVCSIAPPSLRTPIFIFLHFLQLADVDRDVSDDDEEISRFSSRESVSLLFCCYWRGPSERIGNDFRIECLLFSKGNKGLFFFPRFALEEEHNSSSTLSLSGSVVLCKIRWEGFKSV